MSTTFFPHLENLLLGGCVFLALCAGIPKSTWIIATLGVSAAFLGAGALIVADRGGFQRAVTQIEAIVEHKLRSAP